MPKPRATGWKHTSIIKLLWPMTPAYLPARLNLERVATQPYIPQGIIWGDPDQGRKEPA